MLPGEDSGHPKKRQKTDAGPKTLTPSLVDRALAFASIVGKNPDLLEAAQRRSNETPDSTGFPVYCLQSKQVLIKCPRLKQI